MDTFFIGLFTTIIGLLLVFAGYQFYRILLPIWGFFAGFTWAAQGISAGMGTGFLETLLGWSVGLFAGLILGITAYFFYQVAVGVFVGFIGYWVAGSSLLAIGIPPGFFVATVSVIIGFALAAIALVFNAPKGLLVLASALGGATATIAGLLIMFGQAPISILGTSFITEIIRHSFWWSLMWIALAVIGGINQFKTSQVFDESISYPYSSDMSSMGAKGGKSTNRDKDKTKKHT